VEVPAGTTLFVEGTEADALYLLERGQVEIMVRGPDGDRSVALLTGPAYFGELGLLLAYRTASARALTEVCLWTLPRRKFEQLAQERAAIGLNTARSLAHLIDVRSRERVGAASRPERDDQASAPPTRAAQPRRNLSGIAAAVAVPAALWMVGPPAGMTLSGWHVSAIMVGAAIAWLSQAIPDFAVAVARATAWGLAGLAPIHLAFGGFANEAWVLALSAMAVASVMQQSGLFLRMALLLIRSFSTTQAGQVFGLLTGGIFTTPLVPSATARAATGAAITSELADSLHYPERSPASAAIAFAALIGYTSFSSAFMTGRTTNFFVLGLLPPSLHIDWLHWLVFAAPAAIMTLIGALGLLRLLFPPGLASRADATIVHRQQRVLGPMTRREYAAVVALVVMLAGLILLPRWQLDLGWAGAASLVVLLAAGALDPAALRGIDWGYLIFFGLLVGSGGVFQSVGIDRWVESAVVPVTHWVRSPEILVVFLGVFVACARLVLARAPADFLLCLALVPIAPKLGLSPWVVGFVILTISNTWLIPTLSDSYLLARTVTKGALFTDRDGMLVGAGLVLLALMAIAASLPYWRALGLLAP